MHNLRIVPLCGHFKLLMCVQIVSCRAINYIECMVSMAGMSKTTIEHKLLSFQAGYYKHGGQFLKYSWQKKCITNNYKNNQLDATM